MHQPPSILVYGRDSTLLRSRCWVLQAAGFQVSTAETLAEAQDAAAQQSADLLVICHTLSAAECREALRWAHTHPAMKRIVLTAHGLPCSSLADADEEMMSQFAGARELVAVADRLLSAGQPA